MLGKILDVRRSELKANKAVKGAARRRGDLITGVC